MDISIIHFIPYGKENAIKRDELIRLCKEADLIDCKLSDDEAYRILRRLLEKERIDYVILNNCDGKGYYRPTKEDYAELRKYIHQEEARAKRVFKNIQQARKLEEDYKCDRLEHE